MKINRNKIYLEVKDSCYMEELFKVYEIPKNFYKRHYFLRKIKVNEEFKRKDIKLKKGDIVTIELEEENSEIEPIKMDLDIVYEDNWILLLNKPAGLLTHRSRWEQYKTLENGVKYYFLKCGIKQKVRFINRLDRETSGLIMVAKNRLSAGIYSELMKEKKIHRKYLALVEGKFKNEKGIINLPIYKEGKEIKRKVDLRGKFALTKYNVLKRTNDLTFLELELLTGRTHQIRVHLSHLGYPIIGDPLYNAKSQEKEQLMLFSYYMKFYSISEDKYIEKKINPNLTSLK